jgi:hypothetical protein
MGMKIAASIYVDHQDEIQFPVGFITRDFQCFDRIYFFGSDKANTALLEEIRDQHLLRDRITCVTIDHKVVTSFDISIAQNKCLDYLVAHDGCEYFMTVQADILLTDRAKAIMKDWIATRQDLKDAYHLTVLHARLFIPTHPTYFGFTMMGRESDQRFVGDGAYLRGTPYNPHEWNCLDVGYLGIEQYYRHIARHRKTWKENLRIGELADLYHRDRKKFIMAVLEHTGHECPGVPFRLMDLSDPVFKDVIESMGLQRDYQEVQSAVAELKAKGVTHG